MAESAQKKHRVVGRYAIFDPIAAGGMATVHLGRLLGEVGFTRTVAIKRLHAQYAADPEFVSMFIDEARLAARVRHPNVVQTLDVIATSDELCVVMDYIEGESLARMARAATLSGARMEPKLVARIMVDTLHGLHAAHEAKNEAGEALAIVHRDVSPQNVLVGTDGIARVLDFGVAKAVGQVHTTREGQLKGKLAYMAPEQLLGHDVTRRTDVFAASIMFWELLVGKRLFGGLSEGEIVRKVLDVEVTPPSRLVPNLPPGLDAVVMRGLAREPDQRYPSAAEMAEAIELCLPVATPRAVGTWVKECAADTLATRAKLVADIESSSSLAVAAPTAEDSKRIAAGAARAPSLAPAQIPGAADPASDLTAASSPTSMSTRYASSLVQRRSATRRFLQFGVLGIVIGGVVVGWQVSRSASLRAARPVVSSTTASAESALDAAVATTTSLAPSAQAAASGGPATSAQAAPSASPLSTGHRLPASKGPLDPKPRASAAPSATASGQRLYTRD